MAVVTSVPHPRSPDASLPAPLAGATAALRRGDPIIVVDHVAQDTIGMLVLAAEHASAEQLHRVAKLSRGESFLALTAERCDALGLDRIQAQEDDLDHPAATMTISAVEGVTHGMGVSERARTIAVAIDPDSGPRDIRVGGHVRPYRSRVGGVLERAGYTEAAIDLARIAEITPAALMSEVIADDGAVCQGDALFAFAEREGIPVLRIADLIAYRRRTEHLVERVTAATIATRRGEYLAVGYLAHSDEAEHMALVLGDVTGGDVLVYIHRACWEGDVFRSTRCDCRARLDAAQAAMGREGRGVLVHLATREHFRHHDRILDDQLRDYGVGAHILADLGLTTIRVLSERARPLPGVEGYGLHITGYQPLLGHEPAA